MNMKKTRNIKAMHTMLIQLSWKAYEKGIQLVHNLWRVLNPDLLCIDYICVYKT